MTDIEQALTELEDEVRGHRPWLEREGFTDILSRMDHLAALRRKEARENALYAPQWRDDAGTVAAPSAVVPLKALIPDGSTGMYDLIALHPFNKAEGKYSGEVIRGKELAELLNGQPVCTCQVESGEGAWNEAHEPSCPKAES